MGFTQEVSLPSGEQLVFRPLGTTDIEGLAAFLEALSPDARRYSSFESYDLVAARALCEAINRYDKLRFVIESSDQRIVGLLELSFGIPETDIQRFNEHGIGLNQETDCRFGPTLADDYQSKGLGSLVFPLVAGIARGFGRNRITLLGGVLRDNHRAIHWYKKLGFVIVGEFVSKSGGETLDMMLEL